MDSDATLILSTQQCGSHDGEQKLYTISLALLTGVTQANIATKFVQILHIYHIIYRTHGSRPRHCLANNN